MNSRIWPLPLALVLLALAWLWLQLPTVALLPGDEPLYLLIAQRWLDGNPLYDKLFLAHPPARIVELAALLALDVPAAWAKIVAPLATLATAGLLAYALREEIDRQTQLLIATLFLLTPVVLGYGPLLVGVEQALACVALATLLLLADRWLWAGILLSLGAQFALHVGVLVPPLLIWAWRDHRLVPLVQGLLLGLMPLALELAWWGQPMLDQVFAYHFKKVSVMGAQHVPDRVLPFLKTHVVLILAAALGIFRGGVLGLRFALAGLGALALVLAWPRLQPYYFLLPIPWLVLAAALAWQDVPQRFARVALALVLLASGLPTLLETWQRRPQLQQADAEMKQLSAQVLTLAQENHATLLWGDGALVPLLSLHTTLPIALEDTDLNAQRFQSGVTPPGPHLDAVLAQKPLLVVVPYHGLATVPVLRDRLLKETRQIGQFDARAANFSGLLLLTR